MQQKTEDYRAEVFLHCANSTCSKIKQITINILFYKTRQLVVHRIRIRSPATYESASRRIMLADRHIDHIGRG